MKTVFTSLAALLMAANMIQAQPVRRVLMEEYTGTWCSNCPRGIASVQHQQKRYGDRFIAIAVHQESYDPMKNKLYASGNGYPSCELNRSINTDPFFGTSWNYSDPIGIIHNIDQLLNQTCYADVSVAAQWKDAQRNIIGVTATANFTFDDTQSDYRWAFVVTEDGMKGPEGDRYWMQQNKYVGDTDWLVMPEMKPFVNGSGLMEMEYDHVAVDGAGVRQGLENSVVPPIVKGEPNTFTYDIDISANTQIQNRDNLHVVAILLSSKYNDVENAAVCEISPVDDTTPLSLRPVLQEQKEMPHVFNLEGTRINNSSVMQGKGIRILEGKAYLNH